MDLIDFSSFTHCVAKYDSWLEGSSHPKTPNQSKPPTTSPRNQWQSPNQWKSTDSTGFPAQNGERARIFHSFLQESTDEALNDSFSIIFFLELLVRMAIERRCQKMGLGRFSRRIKEIYSQRWRPRATNMGTTNRVNDKIIVINTKFSLASPWPFPRLHKTFITDRGRPYTDTPCVITPELLKSSQPIGGDPNFCMALNVTYFVRYSIYKHAMTDYGLELVETNSYYTFRSSSKTSWKAKVLGDVPVTGQP